MGWNVYLESEDDEAHTQIAQTCHTTADENECTVSGPFDLTGLKAKTVTVGAGCNAEEYAPGKTYTTCARGNEFGHAVSAGFNSVTVTLNDPNPPTNVIGSNIPTAAQHGSIAITGSATDTIAGLLSLSIVNSSGEVISGPVSAGACNYSLLTPCPTSVASLSLPLNTEILPEGPSQIRILATNAAHGEAMSSPYTLIVLNHANAGGETHKENTRNPTTVSTTTGTSTSTSSTTATAQPGSHLPHRLHLPIQLSELKIRHRVLSLSGRVATDIKGSLQLSIHARLRDGHLWTTKIKAPLHRSQFDFIVHLVHGLRNGRTTLELSFPGNSHYQATRLQRTLVVHW